MESQPQNPEFRNYPENFHPCSSSFCWNLLRSKLEMQGAFIQIQTCHLAQVDSSNLPNVPEQIYAIQRVGLHTCMHVPK